MKRSIIPIVIFAVLTLISPISTIAEVSEYSIDDFLKSDLFPNQYGNMSNDINFLRYSMLEKNPASYSEINEAFPGAVERHYEGAEKLRNIVFSETQEYYDELVESGVEKYYKDEELLYSYWKATDGVFCVIWKLGCVSDGVDFVAGRSFGFSSIPNKQSLSTEEIQNVIQLSRYNGCFFEKMPYVCPSSLMWLLGTLHQVVFVWENDGEIEFSCYLVGDEEKIVFDISIFMEKEFDALGKYVSEIERGLKP